MDDATEGLSELLAFNTELNEATFKTAEIVAAVILAVALIFVVWALATKQENAKTYLIAWVIALVLTLGFLIKS